MAVQQWTIMKLVGPAAEHAAERFDKWFCARRGGDESGYWPEQWRPSTRRSAATYFARLQSHRFEMPIAYFSQHIDRWSHSGQMSMHLPGEQPLMLHDNGELLCYQLPDKGRMLRMNRRHLRAAQFPETQWIASRLVEAANAYGSMWHQAVLFINRESISPSPTDELLRKQASIVPKWATSRSG